MAPPPLRLSEELILLMLDEDSGYLEMVPGWDFACVMAGAVVAGLSLAGRLDTDLESLRLLDSTPTGDPMLDPTLAEVSKSKAMHNAQYWIERIATAGADEIVTASLDRLVDRGILSYESGGFWTLSRTVARTGRYPGAEGAERKEAKARVLDTILNDAIPEPRDAVLIGLMHACDGFKLILSEEDYQERIGRIETLTRLDLVGRTVYSAVRESAFKPKTRRILPTKPIPKLGFMDLARVRDFRTGNIPKAMNEIFEKHGPVAELPFRMGGQRTFAAMGANINHWINKHGRFYLRSKEYIKDLEGVFGASRSLPGMDGAEHHKLRQSLRTPYSRASLARRLPELMDLCRSGISQWQEGATFGATETFQSYISNQVSHLLLGVDCSDYADELIAYEHRALVTHAQRALPKFMLSTPRMRRARKHIARLQEAIQATHTPAQREGKPQYLADAILALHQTDPQFMPHTDLAFPFVASMVASIYLGSSLGFAVYAMVSHPDLHAAVRAEADALFGDGRVPQSDDFNPKSMDVTHRLFLESERMYPVIPWQLRTVMNPCVVEGFELPSHSHLLVSQTASHYSPGLFPDPLRFDIDRYLPERAEHLQPGAYAPYGLGTHVCLGHRFLELQIAVNLLLIAHHVKLEMLPEGYQLAVNPFPTSAPTQKLKFRVAEVRNPL